MTKKPLDLAALSEKFSQDIAHSGRTPILANEKILRDSGWRRCKRDKRGMHFLRDPSELWWRRLETVRGVYYLSISASLLGNDKQSTRLLNWKVVLTSHSNYIDDKVIAERARTTDSAAAAKYASMRATNVYMRS